MNKYEEKRQARIDRLNNAADRAEKHASDIYISAEKMSQSIPFGQPIIVGHHSESRDKNFRKRMGNKFEQAFREQNHADELRARAEAAENNTAISSDDPEAVQKLQEKLRKLEEGQEMMKSVNRYYKKNGTCVGCELITEEQARKLDADAEKSYYKRPFAPYALTNNNQNIRNVKARIESLKKIDEFDFEPVEFDGGRVVADKEINRIQFFFDEKTSEETRSLLKGWGFRFSKYNNNAWQRQINSNGLYAAKQVLEKLEEINQAQEQEMDEGPAMSM